MSHADTTARQVFVKETTQLTDRPPPQRARRVSSASNYGTRR